MDNQIFERICDFVERQQGKLYPKLTRDVTIERQLFLTGFDAFEFILDFSKEFNVDISNFMAADYFEAEGSMSVTIKYWLGMTKKPWKYRKELTLGDLEQAVIVGKLDETVIGKGSR